jgi:hypothetical protein
MVTKQTETVINHTPDSHLRTGFQHSPEPRSRSMGGKQNVIPRLCLSSRRPVRTGIRHQSSVFNGVPGDGITSQKYIIIRSSVENLRTGNTSSKFQQCQSSMGYQQTALRHKNIKISVSSGKSEDGITSSFHQLMPVFTGRPGDGIYFYWMAQ